MPIRNARTHPLTKEELADVVARWRNGETLKRIATSYGLKYGTFLRQTRYAWGAEIKVPASKKTAPLSEPQLSEAVTRWEAGESLTKIAADFKVSASTLSIRTKAARDGKFRKQGMEYVTPQQAKEQDESSKKNRRQERLSEKQLSEILQCWKQGEPMREIAKTYSIPYAALLKQTRHLRKGRNSGRKLHIGDIRNAIERREQGESLRTIAADLKVSQPTLRNEIKYFEANAAPLPRELLTASRFTIALMRYEKGESFAKLTKAYGISINKLRTVLIYECWRRGDSIEAIAGHFGKSRQAVRECILEQKQREQV